MTVERVATPLPVPLSAVVRAGGFIFLSGVVALGTNGKIIDGDITEQTRAVLERVRLLLLDFGLGPMLFVPACGWPTWRNRPPSTLSTSASSATHCPQGLRSRRPCMAVLAWR
jgi:2-iminobutanoate/2-iminopropanoate deaminase